ncbi:GntR family transcriptional regulator [Bordetella petrii]|nr:GntR family transcriptional regulator [Bordetella petrii]
MPAAKKSVQVAAASAKPRRRPRALAARSSDSGEPLYRQLVQHLRNDIIRGVFPVGSQLPTEEELAERFAVSRHTVREALRQLRADGLVASRQGSGTTVMPPPPSTPFNVHRVASIDELIAYAAESRYAVERSDVIDSEDAQLDEAGLPPRQRWLRLQGFRLGNEPAAPPVCWTEVYVAAEFAGVERMLGRQRGPIWRLIEDIYGERLVEVEQMLRVRPVPDELAAGLQVEPGSSVVEVRRTYKNTADKVAEISVNLYPADKFRFNMKLRRA